MVNRQACEWIVEYCKNNEYFSTIKNVERFVWNLVDCFEDGALIQSQLKQMTCWLDANPNRRKKNYARFILNWLNKNKESAEAIKTFKHIASGIGRTV